MVLYHGSNTGNIKVLEPRLADHDRPYVYMTTIEIVAGFYLVNAVERPYYWFPYGFDKEGNVQYHELYPNALSEVASGKKGYIYMIDVDENDTLPFKDIPCAKLGTAPMQVIDCKEITNCYMWLMEQERAGKFKLCRHEDKSEKEIERWLNGLYNYIKDKDMVKTPDCSYARFVKLKFPQIWERYVNNLMF